MPGDISYCLDKKAMVDAQKSFPSGHSGAVFSGYGFLGIFLLALLKTQYRSHNMPKGLVAFGVLFVAAIVAGTRPRDYWHNYEDILAGAIIGFSCAIFAFMLNFRTTKRIVQKQTKEITDETKFEYEIY